RIGAQSAARLARYFNPPPGLSYASFRNRAPISPRPGFGERRAGAAPRGGGGGAARRGPRRARACCIDLLLLCCKVRRRIAEEKRPALRYIRPKGQIRMPPERRRAVRADLEHGRDLRRPGAPLRAHFSVSRRHSGLADAA